MDPNPYAASVLPNPREDAKAADATGAAPGASDLIAEWEKRRLWFNAILIALTFLFALLPPPLITQTRFWTFAVEGALAANICFCFGCVAHWYLIRLGLPRRITGWFLFWAGTLLSMLLTLVALFANFVPWQD